MRAEARRARGALVALTLATTLACRAQRSAVADAPPDASAGVVLEVHRDAVLYGGVPLVLDAPLADWERVLGPPSRAVDRAGGMRIWDAQGLAVRLGWHHPSSAPRVAALWVAMTAPHLDVSPGHVFTGEVRVDVTERSGTTVRAHETFRANMKEADLPKSVKILGARGAFLNTLSQYLLTEDGRLDFVVVQNELQW